MEYEEDDDIFFAKWMSSFWGHNLVDENEKEGRGHKKRQTRFFSERRASLPAKLSSLRTKRLHASTKVSSSGHLKGCKGFREDQDVKCHCHKRASRTPLTDSSCPETRSNSIQEFAESFEKQLHFRSKRSVSLQPEGMKERSERERLLSPKSSSHKKMRGKSEPRREQKEDEGPELALANHNEQFPSQASIEKGYFCAGS
ncbi:leukemia NUP98 fusion partner 1 [Apteryx mantelli]|uniref:Leukemia NUP98 fusion partner 1 n=1 Tax=Apteryx mantelli TaxID=2696672 RepID=A0ABM4EXI5_9AVES|nr:leukemia NUP98 fusion partner 1 [Apteryx rowi]